jgi:hypothetical protein
VDIELVWNCTLFPASFNIFPSVSFVCTNTMVFWKVLKSLGIFFFNLSLFFWNIPLGNFNALAIRKLGKFYKPITIFRTFYRWWDIFVIYVYIKLCFSEERYIISYKDFWQVTWLFGNTIWAARHHFLGGKVSFLCKLKTAMYIKLLL